MCGIAGTLALDAPLAEPDRELVRAMTARLRHRGPDGRRVSADGRAALGAARLKITDLSEAAALPMASDDGAVVLTYNGAVTNFRALRDELGLERRRPLRTGSDAEVLIRLYEELGDSFLDRLSGQFAFCLYDSRRARALIVRDPQGLRPVFTLAAAGRLHFASEIKALLEVPGWDRRLDAEALWDFFSLAYIPGRSTPFAEVRELPGGHLLEVDLRSGRFSERRYHEPRWETDEGMTEADAAAGVRSTLRDAVARSLQADVPAGLTLSGGLDTSALLALAKELGLSRRLHTFSLRIDEPSFDESRYQRLMADFSGSSHHEIRVGPADIMGCLQATAAHLDEPSGDGAAAPTFLLAREARRHVGVLLSGEGGDEVFYAYETYRACRARRLYRRLPAAVRGGLRALAARLPVSHEKLSFDFLSKRFTQGAELGVPEAHLFWRHALDEPEKAALLTCPPPARPTAALFRGLFDSLPYADELDRLAAVDLRYYFIDDLMVKNDRTIMAHSVETRFPYLERDVMGWAARIPARLKVKGLRGRWVQKQAFKDILPGPILRRSNMGLEMPHSLWFFREFGDLARKYFTRQRVERSGLLRFSAVERLWQDHLARRRGNGRPLWCVLSFLIWFDLFIYEGDYRDHLVEPA
jgi:asparagine synthase (glutamine-hydrolysing)